MIQKMNKLLIITVILSLAVADQAMLRAPAEFAQISTETTSDECYAEYVECIRDFCPLPEDDVAEYLTCEAECVDSLYYNPKCDFD